jgi:hypothetical protein
VSGTIVAETTISGGELSLTWCCRTCQREWPIAAEEQELERRAGNPDTRTLPRRERRAHVLETKVVEHQRLQVRTDQLKMEHAALSRDLVPFSQPDHDRHNAHLAHHQRDLKRHKKRKA